MMDCSTEKDLSSSTDAPNTECADDDDSSPSNLKKTDDQAVKIPKSLHGWCMDPSHEVKSGTSEWSLRCVQKHICVQCMVHAVNSTDESLPSKMRLSSITYFCKPCLADALLRKGRVDGCDFKKKGNCYNPVHSKENENKKCECCPDAKDRTYCVNPANPDVLSGSRNCFSSGFAVRRSSCKCAACLHLRDQRKEEDKKAALILTVRRLAPYATPCTAPVIHSEPKYPPPPHPTPPHPTHKHLS
jgi:hypothetical protein